MREGKYSCQNAMEMERDRDREKERKRKQARKTTAVRLSTHGPFYYLPGSTNARSKDSTPECTVKDTRSVAEENDERLALCPSDCGSHRVLVVTGSAATAAGAAAASEVSRGYKVGTDQSTASAENPDAHPRPRPWSWAPVRVLENRLG